MAKGRVLPCGESAWLVKKHRAWVLAGRQFEKAVFRFAGAEVVVAHVGGEEGAAVEVRDVTEVDGVANALRGHGLMCAVRVHADDAGADHFTLLAVVAAGAGGDVDAGAACKVGDGDGAGEVPAAVLVVEAVVGEANEALRGS